MQIRLIEKNDYDKIYALYAHYIFSSTATFDEEAPDCDVLYAHWEALQKDYPFFGAFDEGGSLLGFAYASPLRERSAYRFSCETTIYLSPEHLHQGIGKALYEALFEILEKQRIRSAFACITKENETSIAFHKGFGYSLDGLWPKSGYKFGRFLDVAWMHKDLVSENAPLEEFLPLEKLLEIPVRKIDTVPHDMKITKLANAKTSAKITRLGEKNE